MLDGLPAVRSFAKWGYQRANYLIRLRLGTRCKLNERAGLMSSAAWAGMIDEGNTRGAEFYGYYEKSPWSPDQNHLIVHRASDVSKPARLIVLSKASQTATQLATTSAWNFQQGSLAQWFPDRYSPSVIFNDVVDRKLVARIKPLSGRERKLPWPIQAVHPAGHTTLSINYRRLARLRPEYGYDIEVDNFCPGQSMHQDGIWHVDLSTEQARLVISLQDLREYKPRREMKSSEHKVNHIVYSPAGSHFVFMHRWIGAQGKFSRLYCAESNGARMTLLLDCRMVSHYAWRDENTLLVWARTARDGDRYYLIDVSSGAAEVVGHNVLDGWGDGHPSFSPDRKWIVTDTYPDRARRQHVLLFECETNKLVHVGAFPAPWRFNGPERCDLHPRWSPDGRLISIDSAHDGLRKSYVIDVSGIVD